MGYYDSLPPSFGNKFVVNEAGAAISNFSADSTIADTFKNATFGVDTAGQFSNVAANLTGAGALAPSGGWTFITAPEDISWDVSNSATRVDMFGTNNPPVVAGTRGMRELKLGNSLVEGFVRGVSLEGKIASLESLLNYSLNTTDGFVSVPVYQVWANKKPYGGKQAYYIIKSINISEKMRDTQGNTTRAYVDVEFMQVPKYQVNTGRDSANPTTFSAAPAITTSVTNSANQGVGETGANGKPADGPGAGDAVGATADGEINFGGANLSTDPDTPLF